MVCVQSADTHPRCVWGGLWAGRARQSERGGSGPAGAAAPAELRGKGSTEGHQCCQVSDPGPTRTQILALPAALLTSTVYAEGTVSISKAKTLRRYHFVPLSMVELANLQHTGLGL